MNSEIAILREVVTKVTQLIAGRGIKVTQRGTSAFVAVDPITSRPKRVNIPMIPDNATEKLIMAIQGFIDHEVGHLLDTDFGVVNAANRGGSRLANMHNIIEDTFIERRMRERFPGAAWNLEKLHAFFTDEITKPMVDAAIEAGDPRQVFSALCVPMFRAWAGQSHFIDYMADKWHLVAEPVARIGALKDRVPKIKRSQDALDLARDVLEALLPPPMPEPESGSGEPSDEPAEGSEGEGEREHREKPTRRERDEAVEDDEDEAEPPAGGAEPGDEDAEEADGPGAGELDEDDEGGEDEGGEGESDASDEPRDDVGGGDDKNEDEEDCDRPGDDPEDAGDELGDGEESDDAGEGADGEDGDDGDKAGSDEGESSDGPTKPGDPSEEDGDGDDATKAAAGAGDPAGEPPRDFDTDYSMDVGGFEDELGKEISREVRDAASAGAYVIYTRDFDKIEPIQPGAEDIEAVAALEAAVGSLTGVLQKDLERLIAARSRVVKVPGFRSGRLHGGALHRVFTGDDRVFRRREEHVSKDTAICLLIDMSGSMAGKEIDLAKKAAFALSSVLDRLNVKHEVLGFTTSEIVGAGEIVAEQEKLGRDFSRVEPLVMPIIKGYDERLSTIPKARFASLGTRRTPMRNNVDGECVETAGMRLLARREERKVLLVLSDGLPSARGDHAEQYDHLRRVTVNLERAGLELVGIGIDSDAVSRFYKRHVVLGDIEKLPGEVMGQIKRVLL